jgi:hypothetical protein
MWPQTRRDVVTSFAVSALGAALTLGAGGWPGPVGAETSTPAHRAIIEYTAPVSSTWAPSAGALPTFAFGKPAEVLLVVPGGYVVRQEVPLEQAVEQATYVSRQLGYPIAVTIPNPAGGPPRVEYVGRYWGDLGR